MNKKKMKVKIGLPICKHIFNQIKDDYNEKNK